MRNLIGIFYSAIIILTAQAALADASADAKSEVLCPPRLDYNMLKRFIGGEEQFLKVPYKGQPGVTYRDIHLYLVYTDPTFKTNVGGILLRKENKGDFQWDLKNIPGFERYIYATLANGRIATKSDDSWTTPGKLVCNYDYNNGLITPTKLKITLTGDIPTIGSKE